MVAVGYLHKEVLSILLKDFRVNLDDLEDYVGKYVEGWEDAKEAAHIKSKLDKDHRISYLLGMAYIKSKLDKDHIKSKLDPAHIKSKLDEKFSKTKLDHLKQKMGGAE